MPLSSQDAGREESDTRQGGPRREDEVGGLALLMSSTCASRDHWTRNGGAVVALADIHPLGRIGENSTRVLKIMDTKVRPFPEKEFSHT